MALTAIVPIGLAVTIPSAALVGRISVPGLIASVAAGVAVFGLSRWLFRRGIRSYSGASG